MLKRLIPFGISVLICSTGVIVAEPSVYEMDNDSFRQQYEADISAAEVTSVPQQPTITQVTSSVPQQPTITSLHRQIQRQNERIDGLTTLVEGLNAQLFEFQQQKGSVSPSSDTDNTELLKGSVK